MPERPPRPSPPGIPSRYHDSDRARAAATSAMPQRAPVPPPLPVLASNATAPGAAPPRSAAPGAAADHVRLGWRGLTAAIPIPLITALATALITHWAAPTSLPADDSLRGQIREIAADVRDVKASQRDARTSLAEEMAFTARDIPLLAAVTEHGCSARFSWHEGLRPAEPDWLPPPANGKPPQWQPSMAMLPAPAP